MIHRDPSLSDRPVLKGTRMSVQSVRTIYHYGGLDEVQRQYPHLTQRQIEDALGYPFRYRLLRLWQWMDEPREMRIWQVYLLIAVAGFVAGVVNRLT